MKLTLTVSSGLKLHPAIARPRNRERARVFSALRLILDLRRRRHSLTSRTGAARHVTVTRPTPSELTTVPLHNSFNTENRR
jgi:hypothetical protein